MDSLTPIPDYIDGINLAPLIRGADSFENPRSFAMSQFPRGKKMGYALRDERYRFVAWFDTGGKVLAEVMLLSLVNFMTTLQILTSNVTLSMTHNTKLSPKNSLKKYSKLLEDKKSLLPIMKITYFLFYLTCLSCINSAYSQVIKQERPNIIFFIADDMLPEHFNCLTQGKDKYLTPNLDRLAREGTLMLQQHVVSPVCTLVVTTYLLATLPAVRKTITSSKYKKNGQSIVEFNTHILSTDRTLPALLKAAGYTTGMAGKDHVVEVAGLKPFKNFKSSAQDPANKAQLIANHDHTRQAMIEIGFDFADSLYHNNPSFLGLYEVAVQNMDWITDAGVRFIKQARTDPFFLYFATTVPHGPTQAKRSWKADPLLTAIGYLDKPLSVQPSRETIPKRLRNAGLPVNDNTANLLWLDDALGALLDTLEATGEIDNTVIFFFNDHGQLAKGTVYQGGVHNPSSLA